MYPFVNDDQMLTAGFLCLAQGFHEKLLKDFVNAVQTKPGFSELHYKKKSKVIKNLHDSPLGRNLHIVIDQAHSAMKLLPFRLSNKDVENLWLFIDHLLCVKIAGDNFINSTSMFSYILCEVKPFYREPKWKKIHDALTEIEISLGNVALTLSDEKFRAKLDNAKLHGKEEFYTRDVFDAWEVKELERGTSVAEWFLKNIKQPLIFEVVKKHKKDLGPQFQELFNQAV